MKPLERLYSIVFTITTAVIFFLWGYIESTIVQKSIIGIPLGALIALGTYRSVLEIIIYLISNIYGAKKLFFGRYYLEGVWVGCYLSKNKTPVYFIEEYDQDFDTLIIRGRSYFHNGAYKGSWTSEKVSIDVEKGKISYNYLTDFINNTHINQGQAEFNFIRKEAGKAPFMLVGFSSDLYNNEKNKNFYITD
ncbi:hypothetical protein [Clostridium sp. YIM B02569]|uniref:hypothetical protein n=1 Tax=Clostridium sp. YIM B02569 TaxID=2911967 RepID=UPI001EEB4713|nr:hypothetical protein [Clostridium sp. YIM B02569]